MKIDILDHLRAEASYHYTGIFNEAADEIQRLRTENWQLKQACGYPIPADKETPQNPFKCGICDARNKDQSSGKCVAGTDLPERGPCPKCGAGDNESCRAALSANSSAVSDMTKDRKGRA